MCVCVCVCWRQVGKWWKWVVELLKLPPGPSESLSLPPPGVCQGPFAAHRIRDQRSMSPRHRTTCIALTIRIVPANRPWLPAFQEPLLYPNEFVTSEVGEGKRKLKTFPSTGGVIIETPSVRGQPCDQNQSHMD